MAQGVEIAKTSGYYPNPIVCSSENNCRIPHQHISNETDEPFMFLGKVVNDGHPRHSDYDDALRKFRRTQACLISSERMAQTPNLLKIDWANLRGRHDLEVCLFRIFRSLGNLEAIRAWLEFHAFEVRGPTRVVGENYRPRNECEPLYSFGGSWDSDEAMRHRPSLLWRLTGLTLIHGTSVNIGLSESGELVDVRVS